MTMRQSLQSTMITPSFPLLEAGDLPGEEDWSVIEALHCDDSLGFDDDRLASFSVASFDD